MRSYETSREQAFDRRLHERVVAPENYVDMGLIMHVVQHDLDGTELIPSAPPMRILRTHRRGGQVNTITKVPHLCGPSRRPVVWYCSEDQEPLILHPDDVPLGILAYGSEGAGKSYLIAMWHMFRIFEHLGERREGGVVAPTAPRLKFVRDAMISLYPSHWYHHYSSLDLMVFADGSRLQHVGAFKKSDQVGSPLQGFNWSWASGDEMQDMVERHADFKARGRSAKHARFKQLRTATAKDDHAWRTLRTQLLANTSLWFKTTLLGPRSPFVYLDHWDQMKLELSPREFRRRVLTEDLGPERQLYYTWDRKENLRPYPRVGPKDVTAIIIRTKTGQDNRSMLGGHDPGKLHDVTVLLKAFDIQGTVYWWVVGEVTTDQTTTEEHTVELIKVLRRDWGCEVPTLQRHIDKIHIRCDPYSRTSENRPDKDVFRIMDRMGLDVKSAQYSAKGTGAGTIKREARIEMVCSLICNAAGVRRLFVDCDDRGRPVAPRLVEAFETMERDEFGDAETERKGRRDLSHWPAALGYGLWPFEKESARVLKDNIRRRLGDG